MPAETYRHQLTEAAVFNRHYTVVPWKKPKTISHQLKKLRQDMTGLMSAASKRSETKEQYVITGEGKLLDVRELSSNMDQLRKLFAV